MTKQNATARWLAKKMDDKTFRDAYEQAGKEIDAIDTFIRLVDDRRIERGLSKAELARQIGQNAASLNRLLTSGGNPTLRTMLDLAEKLGLTLTLTEAPQQPRTKKKKKMPREAAHA